MNASSELFAPREVQSNIGSRPNDETITVRLSAYASHILRLVGKRKRRTTEDQAAAIIEDWVGYHRPRG